MGWDFDWNCFLLPEVVICSGITWRKQPVENKHTKYYKTIQRNWVLGMRFLVCLWTTPSLPTSFYGQWRRLTVIYMPVWIKAMGKRDKLLPFDDHSELVKTSYLLLSPTLWEWRPQLVCLPKLSTEGSKRILVKSTNICKARWTSDFQVNTAYLLFNESRYYKSEKDNVQPCRSKAKTSLEFNQSLQTHSQCWGVQT